MLLSENRRFWLLINIFRVVVGLAFAIICGAILVWVIFAGINNTNQLTPVEEIAGGVLSAIMCVIGICMLAKPFRPKNPHKKNSWIR